LSSCVVFRIQFVYVLIVLHGIVAKRGSHAWCIGVASAWLPARTHLSGMKLLCGGVARCMCAIPQRMITRGEIKTHGIVILREC